MAYVQSHNATTSTKRVGTHVAFRIHNAFGIDVDADTVADALSTVRAELTAIGSKTVARLSYDASRDVVTAVIRRNNVAVAALFARFGFDVGRVDVAGGWCPCI